MSRLITSSKINYGILAGIVLLIALILIIAPLERTLGAGIKVVYIHVALIWTGMTGILINGFIGAAVLISGNQKWQQLGQIIGWVALGFLTAGWLMSMVAAQVNWGGIFWGEPRYLALVRVLVVALIVQVLGTWPLNVRLKGLGYLFIPLFFTWLMQITPLVFHPDSPIQNANSSTIQATFLSLFALCFLGAVWGVLNLREKF